MSHDSQLNNLGSDELFFTSMGGIFCHFPFSFVFFAEFYLLKLFHFCAMVHCTMYFCVQRRESILMEKLMHYYVHIMN